MRPQPIFDTNIFGHVQDGSIPVRDWRFLLKHRPGHGWPLKFRRAKEQIDLACKLSKGRLPLEEPRLLLCKEVLGLPFPDTLPRLRPELLADHLEIVRCANSPEDIRNGRVRVKKLLTRGDGHGGFAGFNASIVAELVSGDGSPKKEWIKRLEAFASDVYPEWREHFRTTGQRLPNKIRAELEPVSRWYAERNKWPETIVEWLEAAPTPELLLSIAKRLDAVFEFTLFVDREFLLRRYNPEKHESDVYDQFQLHYLAMDRFVIVSEDTDLFTRTARSSQSERIQSLDKFLQSL